MRYVQIIFFAILFFVCATVFADDPVAASNAVTDVLKKGLDAIPSDVSPVAAVLVGIGAEILVRAIPTAKPKSFFLLLSLGLGLIAGICTKASAILDKLVQNVKDPVK